MAETENADNGEEPKPDDAERPETAEEAGASVVLGEIGGFLKYVGRRFGEDRCLRMAAGLSYTSLLAIVPLTAIAFSMLAAFPVFSGVRESLQEVMFANLLPSSAEASREYFDMFVKNTTSLSAVGIVALAATAVLLLGTIEADLNAIFRVARPRALLPRLLVFWALLTLGPLLLGASFSLSTYFFAATEWLGIDTAKGPLGFAATLVPTLMIFMLLTIFYMVIPNRPVGFIAALVGGVLAGLAFTVLRKTFGWYVVTFPTYQNIYGALSVVPIFLVWMYLSWLVVLVGAVLTASMSEWQSAGGKPLSSSPCRCWPPSIAPAATASARRGPASCAPLAAVARRSTRYWSSCTTPASWNGRRPAAGCSPARRRRRRSTTSTAPSVSASARRCRSTRAIPGPGSLRPALQTSGASTATRCRRRWPTSSPTRSTNRRQSSKSERKLRRRK